MDEQCSVDLVCSDFRLQLHFAPDQSDDFIQQCIGALSRRFQQLWNPADNAAATPPRLGFLRNSLADTDAILETQLPLRDIAGHDAESPPIACTSLCACSASTSVRSSAACGALQTTEIFQLLARLVSKSADRDVQALQTYDPNVLAATALALFEVCVSVGFFSTITRWHTHERVTQCR